MNHFAILKRALTISWRYRAMWIFGAILGGLSAMSNSFDTTLRIISNTSLPKHLPPSTLAFLINFLLIFVFLFLLIYFALFYVCTNSLIQMSAAWEEEQRYSVREGFLLGTSRAVWRLFGLHLLIWFPFMLSVIALVVLIFLLFIGGASGTATGDNAEPVVALLVFLFIFVILAIIIISLLVGSVLAVFWELATRVTVLEDRGIFDSIREAWRMVRTHFGDTAIFWLISVGISLISPLLMIPATILGLILGAIIGVIPGLIAYFLATLFSASQPVIWGLGIGFIPVLLINIATSAAISGFIIVFRANLWTQVYQEFRAIEAIEG